MEGRRRSKRGRAMKKGRKRGKRNHCRNEESGERKTSENIDNAERGRHAVWTLMETRCD